MSKTDTQRAYDLLHGDIVAGDFAPGAKLKIIDLRHRYGIGTAPLREALAKLSGERMISAEGRRGFRIIQMSVEDVQDISRVRLLLELECLRESVKLGDDEWEGSVAAAYHRLKRAEELEQKDPTRAMKIEARNADFHEALVSACQSPWLKELRTQVFVYHERYRNLSRSLSDPNRDTAAEHAQIFEAALDHDEDRLIALTTLHVEKTTEAVVRFMEAMQSADGRYPTEIKSGH